MPVEFIRITPGKMAKIRITSDTRIFGRHVPAGQVVELPEGEAHQYVVANKAEFYTEPEPEKAPEKKSAK